MKTIHSLLCFLLASRSETNFDKYLDMTLIKSELRILILCFAKGPKKYLDNSITFVEMLSNVIEECKSPIKSINDITDLLNSIFISGAIRSKYLQAAYSYLGTILRKTVDCQKCFSTAAFVGNKIHSKTSDDMLDACNLFKKLFKTIIYLFWNPNKFLKK